MNTNTARRARKETDMGNRKCRHKLARSDWWFDYDAGIERVTKRWCDDCGLVPPLGPANDDDINVQREIEAAAAASAAMTEGEAPDFSVAEQDGFNDWVESPLADLAAWHIGWLAAEATHDHSDGWAWDVTRPLAEQLAEMERADEEADRVWLERNPAAWFPPPGTVADASGAPDAESNAQAVAAANLDDDADDDTDWSVDAPAMADVQIEARGADVDARFDPGGE